MENAGYVYTGWVLTGAALAAYATFVIVRTRRAARVLREAREVTWR